MRSTFFCLLAFLGFATCTVTAQDIDYRPNLIPPSPDASALGKYAEFPVGLYTGTLPITIPIYNVSDGDMKVPIDLSYCASGNKVEEAASLTGLGFSLDAGGAIMRSVRNLPDDYPTKGFLDYSITYSEDYLNNNPNRFTQLEEIAKGCGDAEPDAYFFNFNGYTGSFTFDWNGQVRIYSKIAWKTQVLKQDGANPKKITGWKFICDDGTIYTFSAAEQATITDNGFPCQAGIVYNSAWYLSNITSVNGGRSINFTYEDYTQNFDMYHAVTHRIFCYPNSGACQFTAADPTVNFTRMVYACKRVKTITTSDNGTTVTFNYTTARSDEPGTNLKQLDEIIIKNKDATELRRFSFTYDYSTGRLSLRSIKKFNTDEPPYKFDYSAELLPPRIGNSGSLSSYGQDHWGYYNGKADNTSLLPPVWKNDPSSSTGAQIFYKGGDRSCDVIKMQAGILTRITYPSGGSDQFFYQPHDYGSIGNQSVESLGEFNTVIGTQDNSVKAEASGNVGVENTDTRTPTISGEGEDLVRVDLTLQGLKPSVGNAYVQISKYGAPPGTSVYYYKQFKLQLGVEPVTGDFVRLPKDTKYTVIADAVGEYVDRHPTQPVIYPAHASVTLNWVSKTFTNVPIKKKIAGGLRIAYIKKFAYAGDPSPTTRQFLYDDGVTPNETSSGVLNETPYYESLNANYYAAGETACAYDLRIAQNKAILGYGPHIGYGKVTELSGNSGSNGKTVYSFTSEKDYPAVSYKQPPFQQASNSSFATGNVLDNSVFKKESDLNKPVNQMTTTNFEIQSASSVNGLKFRFAGGTYSAAKFTKGAYEIKFGDWYPLNIVEKEYASDAVNYIQKERNFFYENKRLKRERFSRNRNASGYDQVDYSYADDFINPTTAIQSMLAKNMIGLPLEIIKSIPYGASNGVTGGVFNTYSLDATSRLLLSDVRKLQLSAPVAINSYPFAASNATGVLSPNYATEATFEKYDAKENLLQLTGKDGITKSFVYDKHDEAPVVTASGATSDKIAWSGFENTDPVAFGGVWTLPGSYVTTDFVTGKRSYNGIVSINTVGFPSVNYILSFWMKGIGNNFTINGAAIPSPIIWTLYETQITGGGSVSIDTKGGLVDEVRIYPADAQMATASYDQLVGTNTVTDVKSKPGFYEYDNLWRLHLVKDQNKDIVKRTTYEFEVLAPSTFTLTATQTGSYTYQFQLAGGLAGYTYDWDFDDLSTPISGTLTSVSHTFSPLTLTYAVKVKVKSSVNGLATLMKEVTVQKTGGSSACSEVQNIVISRSTSNNKQATFTVPTISGASYWWDFGDNTAATTASAIHVYPTVANTMNYNVNVTVSTGGKSCSAKTSIKINP